MWDDELALAAQRWAEQCIFGHDKIRDTMRFRVGQNVYETSSSRDSDLGNTIREGILGLGGWHSEVRNFDTRTIDSYRYVLLMQQAASPAPTCM